jgi:predicted Zn-dependent protease
MSDAVTRERFFALFDSLCGALQGSERLRAEYAGEDSDFVRLNGGRVRQAGHVRQAGVVLELVDGQRHASAECNLCGDVQADQAQLRSLIEGLRERLPLLPDDPHLLLPEGAPGSEELSEDRLPPATEAVDALLGSAAGLDLVGIHAQGAIHRGYAGSTGLRHWYRSHSFATDFCLYHQADKAVKTTYAGFDFDAAELDRRVVEARERLAVLARPARKIEPGSYRVYLAPAAVAEILGLLSWDGFGVRAQRTHSSPLHRLVQVEAALHPTVNLDEHAAGGLAPRFSEAGFPRPERVPLIRGGRHAGALISPRSAKEFGLEANGCDSEEAPTSLELAGGSLPRAEVLEALGTGVWISNLWYTNFSDRTACRITGMTRFATCWVEDGQVVAPLNVMRFDETLYRMLGSELEALTVEQDFLPSTETYYRRSTDSLRVPGALLKAFEFTL